MKKYIVYITHYTGTKLPPYYIGSSYEEKVLKGYNGTVLSKKYKEIYKIEQRENKNFFKTKILSYHKTREDALKEELRLQKKHLVVKNNRYFNESYAQVNGYFGRDVSGELNPNHSIKWTDIQKENLRKHKINTVNVRNKITGKCYNVSITEWKNNPELEAQSKGRKIKDTSNYGKRDQKGEKNNMTNIIHILNEEDKVIFICKSNFRDFCKDNNLPWSSFQVSYKTGRKLGDKKIARTMLQNNNFDKFIGWHAKNLGRVNG